MTDEAAREPTTLPKRLPEVIEATEGDWLPMPPPDRQPQFRCTTHRRGTVVTRKRSDP